MKPIDIDTLFEKFIREYMKENAGKYTESEWEDKIPELYSAFGKSKLSELGGESPEEYYGKLTGKELCDLLSEHIEEDIPVSDFLCNAIVDSDTEEYLLHFLDKGTDEELLSYAVNLLADKACYRALPIYLEYVTAPDTDENVRELMGEELIASATHCTEELIAAAKRAKAGRNYITEALSTCPCREDIYEILIGEFEKAPLKDAPIYAHMLVKYGDERAVPALIQKISDPKIKYSEFRELKFAIEALGGEYNEQRDFSSDGSYRKIKGNKPD